MVYEMRVPACMSRMFNAVHVSLLKWYKMGTEDLFHLLLCEMMVKKTVRSTGFLQACKQATYATCVVQD